jgi:hypothetical protein
VVGDLSEYHTFDFLSASSPHHPATRMSPRTRLSGRLCIRGSRERHIRSNIVECFLSAPSSPKVVVNISLLSVSGMCANKFLSASWGNKHITPSASYPTISGFSSYRDSSCFRSSQVFIISVPALSLLRQGPHENKYKEPETRPVH